MLTKENEFLLKVSPTVGFVFAATKQRLKVPSAGDLGPNRRYSAKMQGQFFNDTAPLVCSTDGSSTPRMSCEVRER